jgi:hypothetical protein
MEHCLIEYRIQLNCVLYPYQIQYLKKQYQSAHIDPFRNMIVVISIPYYSARLENVLHYNYPSHLNEADINFFQKEKIKNLVYPCYTNMVEMSVSEENDIKSICENRVFKYMLTDQGNWYQTYIFDDIPLKIPEVNYIQSYLDPIYALLLLSLTVIKLFI